MQRRQFLKNTGLIGASIALTGLTDITNQENMLPEWKGFNLLDFFSPNPKDVRRFTSVDQLAWIRDWGFNFVRLPIAYPNYLAIDRTRNIQPDEVYNIDNRQAEKIEKLVFDANKLGLHTSINLHRAPGYCINAGFHEPYNLWKDHAAMDAFKFHWELWAKRFKNVDNKLVSFDLLNEPCVREDMNEQLSGRTAVPGDMYRNVAGMATTSIRNIKPGATVIADGNNIGNEVTPELVDLEIAQSCRGYFPAIISHYKAPWAMKEIDHLPELKYPGRVGDQELNRAMLEAYYAPWINLSKKGVGVHCGECGCWNKTPHDVFIKWFSDVLDILHEHKIGFGLWEFDGDFGILNSNRADVSYTDWKGHKLDKKLLDLLRKNM